MLIFLSYKMLYEYITFIKNVIKNAYKIFKNIFLLLFYIQLFMLFMLFIICYYYMLLLFLYNR